MQVPDLAFELVRKEIAECNQLMKKLQARRDFITWCRIKERRDGMRYAIKIIGANGN